MDTILNIVQITFQNIQISFYKKFIILIIYFNIYPIPWMPLSAPMPNTAFFAAISCCCCVVSFANAFSFFEWFSKWCFFKKSAYCKSIFENQPYHTNFSFQECSALHLDLHQGYINMSRVHLGPRFRTHKASTRKIRTIVNTLSQHLSSFHLKNHFDCCIKLLAFLQMRVDFVPDQAILVLFC